MNGRNVDRDEQSNKKGKAPKAGLENNKDS